MTSAGFVLVTFVAVAFVAAIVFAQDPYNPTGPYPNNFPSLNTSSINAADGLTFSMSLNATSITTGHTVEVTASEFNSWFKTNSVNASKDWPLKGLGVSECGTLNQPLGLTLFRGYYTESNISRARALMLYQPNQLVNCPIVLSEISAYSFYAKSSTVQVLGSCIPEPCSVINASASLEANGFWVNVPLIQQSYHTNLTPGVYTVAAGDEWGQLALLYFVVKP